MKLPDLSAATLTKTPATIKVGGFDFDLYFAHQPVMASEPGRIVWGACSSIHQYIVVEERATEQRRLSILIHETLHAIEEVYGLDLGEEAVTILGKALAQVFQDNDLRSLARIGPWRADTEGGD